MQEHALELAGPHPAARQELAALKAELECLAGQPAAVVQRNHCLTAQPYRTTAGS